MSDIKPPRRYGSREAGRMAAEGRRTDDQTYSTLVVVQENDGTWTFHGLGAPGVTISRDDALAIARGIERAAWRRLDEPVRVFEGLGDPPGAEVTR